MQALTAEVPAGTCIHDAVIFPKLQFRHAMWTAKDMQHLFLWRQPLYSIIRSMVEKVPATWEELVEQAVENGGVQFDATSIYYDLGFVRACGGYIFQYQRRRI